MNSMGKWVAWLIAAVLTVGIFGCISEDEDEKEKAVLTWVDVARFIDYQLGEISDGSSLTCNKQGGALGAGAHCKDRLQGTTTQSTVVQYVEITNDTVLFNGDSVFFKRGFLPLTPDPCHEDVREFFGFGDGFLDYSQTCLSGGLDCKDYGDGHVKLVYTDCQWQEKELIGLETVAIGDGGTNYAGTLAKTPVVPGSVVLFAYNQVAFDDGLGNLIGDVFNMGANSINYATGAIDVSFQAPVANGVDILAEYLIESRIWELKGAIDLNYDGTDLMEQIVLSRTQGFTGTDLTTMDTYTYSGEVLTYLHINPWTGEAAMGTTGNAIDGMEIVNVRVTVDMDGVGAGADPSLPYVLTAAKDYEDGLVFLKGSGEAVWLADPGASPLRFYDRTYLWDNTGPGCQVTITALDANLRTFSYTSPNNCPSVGTGTNISY